MSAGKLRRLEDVVIARAAAEIRRERVANLCVARTCVVAEKRRQRHQKAGRAEAALQPVRGTKCILKGVQFSRGTGEAFNGLEVMAVGLYGEHDARPYRLAIEQNCTCATDTVLASDVRTCQLEFLTDEVTEQKTRLDIALVLQTVDG